MRPRRIEVNLRLADRIRRTDLRSAGRNSGRRCSSCLDLLADAASSPWDGRAKPPPERREILKVEGDGTCGFF